MSEKISLDSSGTGIINVVSVKSIRINIFA